MFPKFGMWQSCARRKTTTKEATMVPHENLCSWVSLHADFFLFRNFQRNLFYFVLFRNLFILSLFQAKLYHANKLWAPDAKP